MRDISQKIIRDNWYEDGFQLWFETLFFTF